MELFDRKVSKPEIMRETLAKLVERVKRGNQVIAWKELHWHPYLTPHDREDLLALLKTSAKCQITRLFKTYKFQHPHGFYGEFYEKSIQHAFSICPL